MAASHGHLPQFDGTADDWEVFTEQLTHYFTANGITEEAKKRSILLSACGTQTFRLIKTLLAPTLVTAKTFAEIAKVVQDHVQPKPSVIMRRFRFNTCSRNQGESITTFVARLRELASHCEYGDTAIAWCAVFGTIDCSEASSALPTSPSIRRFSWRCCTRQRSKTLKF